VRIEGWVYLIGKAIFRDTGGYVRWQIRTKIGVLRVKGTIWDYGT
jgi:hypothetical protein